MNNKKILITGGTGFIGSHLTELCVKRGYKVYAFDRYNPEYNLNCLKIRNIKKILILFLEISEITTQFLKHQKEKT